MSTKTNRRAPACSTSGRPSSSSRFAEEFECTTASRKTICRTGPRPSCNCMASSDRSAFDGKAHDYDADFTATGLGSVLRVRVWDRLAVLFAGRERLLELGCGTGEDAVWLAR